ncbi:MAG: DNA polymerase [Candidatus Paceibacterota bacterium]|jgi:DNA polymerase-1
MKTLLLIDANSMIHRCFHAVPPLVNKKNEPTGALYGVSNILLKIIQSKKPEYAAALFDRPEATFREQKYAQYKAQRPKTADELIPQLKKAHDLFESFSIKWLEIPGYEADDLIGTLAIKFKKEKDIKVLILTGDLDSLQLVEDGKILVETFKKGISETMVYDEGAVVERYGIHPTQMIDYKALVGDASDNIPGVAGVGPKTASEILRKYKTLDIFFKEGQKEKSYERINQSKEIALLSKDLATIITSAPVKININELELNPNTQNIKNFFDKNDFSSLIKRVDGLGENTKKKETKKKAESNQLSVFGSIKQNSEDIKIGYNLKDLYKKQEILGPIFDIKIGLELLGVKPDGWEDASEKIFKKILPLEEFLDKSFAWLSQKIKTLGLEKVFYNIEMPLVKVLSQMEKSGVLINLKKLKDVQKELNVSVKKIEDIILKEIGEEINLNSPKQLLSYFQKQGLKIKSTSAQTLEKISEGYPVVKRILEYREFFKMKTTYLDSFEKLIGEDKRIHPTFLQLGAATGRLSCQNPNLQNIPQESEWSQKIRNIFIPSLNNSLVSFDYSQIELRVIAHLSQDKNMIGAFKKGEDIHTLTAQKIFNTKEVLPQQRRLAKTLNFGMIYGMGYRAFSQTAHIPSDQAKEFIKKYFEEFPAIKEWQKMVLETTRETEISSNINGRFRNLPAINSLNQFLSSSAEREATNMPTQSLAADILKIAMIKVFDYLSKNNLLKKIKIILSIHDELIFDINKELLGQEKESDLIKKIRDIMESSYKLDVPLRVGVKIGKRWGEMN